MDTAKAATVMRMVVYGRQKQGFTNTDWVAIGHVIMEKMESMPAETSAKDIAIAVLENK